MRFLPSKAAPAALFMSQAALNESEAFCGIPNRSEPLDFADDERRALVALRRRKIDDARYPLSPRFTPLRTILAKLDPQPPPPDRPLPLKAYDAPSSAGRRRRR
jgi:hypothetical protein